LIWCPPLEQFLRADARPVADQCYLVDQVDVDLALDVLAYLGEFGDLDCAGAVRAGAHDAAIDDVDDVERLRRIPRDDLQDVVAATFFVAVIDALRRAADVEIGLSFEARALCEDGHADLGDDARIDGGFLNDDIALLEVAPKLKVAVAGEENASCEWEIDAIGMILVRLLDRIPVKGITLSDVE
jgi:hypothetical protein